MMQRLNTFPKGLYALKMVLGCLLFSIVFVSCQKELHEDVLIEGNEPPPFEGVSSIQLNNFLNNLYIDFLGRGPTLDELGTDANIIKTADFSDESMASVALSLQQKYEYIKNYDALTKQRILASVDSLTILYDILLYQNLADQAELVGDTLLSQLYTYYLGQFQQLRDAPMELYNETIDLAEYYKRNIYNDRYDEVNMGSENFTLACFENLFYREPTEEELMQGIVMVDGGSAFLFLQDGNSKLDFINICVASQSFLEGQAVEVYRALLARDPSSIEMAAAVEILNDGGTWKDIQRTVIITEEYAGF